MEMLQLNDLHKTFNPGTVNEKVALNGVSLHMEAGDFATIVGSNGAGKSTLFNAITGGFIADEGSILLGSILSATVLTILPEATRSFDSYRMVVYSLVLILMMIFRPGGLLGSYDFSMSRIVEKIMNGELFRKKAKEGADHE